MRQGKGTEPNDAQVAAIDRELCDLAALTTMLIEMAESTDECEMHIRTFVLLQSALNSLSAEGIARWQQRSSKLLTMVREDRAKDASNSTGEPGDVNKRRDFKTFAVSILDELRN